MSTSTVLLQESPPGVPLQTDVHLGITFSWLSLDISVSLALSFFSSLVRWRRLGCHLLPQILHFTFSVHTLAMWLGEKQRKKKTLSSLTHCSLSLTVIFLKVMHSVSSWPARL